MYSLYHTKLDGDDIIYKFVNETHLFGCNIGFIPKALLGTIQNQSEPYKWRLSSKQIINILKLNADEIVINAFPTSESELNLYRIRDVFGYCDQGWTPILLHLDCLVNGVDPKEVNVGEFRVNINDIDEHIFSILYMRGSIKDGKLTDKWVPPRPSATNSTFMWPHVAKYFSSEITSIVGVKNG